MTYSAVSDFRHDIFGAIDVVLEQAGKRGRSEVVVL